MTKRKRDRSLGDGVYFAPHDYVGILRRLLILLIDALVVVAMVGVFVLVWDTMYEQSHPMFGPIVVALVWLYIVGLKRSRFRTLGYRVAGAKLISLKGKSPSLFMLTFREVLWAFGPFNIIVDVIWCSMDNDKQSLRDRMSQMCVVRESAEPIGTGEIHLTYHNTLGYTFMYPEIMKPKSDALSEK